MKLVAILTRVDYKAGSLAPMIKIFDLSATLEELWTWAMLIDSQNLSFNSKEFEDAPLNGKLTLQHLEE